MPVFTYKAKRHDGDTYEDRVDAPDRFSVYDHIRKEGATVISIERETHHSLVPVVQSAVSMIGSVKTSEKVVLTRNLATMMHAGLPLTRALSVMERQTNNRKLKDVLSKLGSSISKGSTLNESLRAFPNVFSPLFVSMVRAGEESGKLSEALTVLAEQMDRSYQLKKKVYGALIYPAIIIIAMIVVGILMLIYVVPTLTQTFTELGVDLPTSTRIIIGTSNFLTNNTTLSLLVILAMIVLVALALRTREGRRTMDFTLLHIPLITPVVRELNAARTARTLASLLSAGVDVIASIAITRDVMQNSYFQEVLAKAEENIRAGKPLSQAFIENESLYPPVVGEMTAVGEETGQLAHMLQEVALFYEQEVDQRTKNLSTVIEPFLMIVIGIVVGFFALSMITPIYSISGSI